MTSAQAPAPATPTPAPAGPAKPQPTATLPPAFVNPQQPGPGAQPPPAGQQPGQLQPGQPGAPPPGTALLTPLPTLTPFPTFTPVPPTNTPTVTPTRTPTPYPTFVPQITPTLAWPTPAPSALFSSRYIASVFDPGASQPQGAPPGSGALRGRVLDWRGLGVPGFRIHASGSIAQAEATSSADGQFTITGLPPGLYEITIVDSRSEAAREIPILAGQVTSLDWVESARPGFAPAAAPIVATPTLPPPSSPTPSPTPPQVQRATTAPARPSGPEVAIFQIISLAAGQVINAFFTGAAVMIVLAVVMIAWSRRRI